MTDKNKEQKSLIKIDSKGIQRVQHSISITNKILKEHENRLILTEYESVKIGTQIWMTKNLNVDRFRNGDLIPEVKSNEEWIKACEERNPAWCYYDNDSINGEKYGKLYNWFAVNDSRILAPLNWNIPNNHEFKLLVDHLGGFLYAGLKMKTTSGWYAKGNGTNESGFSALSSGYRMSNGEFHCVENSCTYWTSEENNSGRAYAHSLTSLSGVVINNTHMKHWGYSIRCLKD
jgi:uncharacterized protein (TIGR02145 family)